MSTTSPPAEVLADAAARRRSSTDVGASGAQIMHEHEQRQMFRRLIDPGIFRPNSKEVAMNALKTLSMIAENILREPENTKYRSFKHENDTIKRRLIQPKGALEYALALGFRPEVTGFQSIYVFHPNPSRLADLRVGAAILKEALDRETEKEERERRNNEEQKAAVASAAQNVKLAFLDDRNRKAARDARDRALREAREAERASRAEMGSPEPGLERERSPISMPPGAGHMLTEDGDRPPPYDG